MEEAFVSTQQPTFLDDENEEMSMPCKSEQFGLPGMLDEDLDVVVFQPSQFSIDLVREEDFELTPAVVRDGQACHTLVEMDPLDLAPVHLARGGSVPNARGGGPKWLLDGRSSKSASRLSSMPTFSTPTLTTRITRHSPLQGLPKGFKSYDLPSAKPLPQRKVGEKRDRSGTPEEQESLNVECTVKRALEIMSPSMKARVAKLKPSEAGIVGSNEDLVVVEMLRKKVGKGRAMLDAVNTLTSFSQFCFMHYGHNLVEVEYEASPGLISIYLSAHSAPSMPASRLGSLKYAFDFMGALCEAKDPVLKPFSVRVSLGGHAPACSVRVLLHLEHVACGHPSRFVRFYAASFMVMIMTSLRYIDAFRSPIPVKSNGPGGEALDGKAYTSKSSTLPMLWYCPCLSFTSSAKWFHAMDSQRADVEKSKSMFPLTDSSKVESAKCWVPGTSQKAVVLATYVYILMLPPLSLTRKQALAIARLHGVCQAACVGYGISSC